MSRSNLAVFYGPSWVADERVLNAIATAIDRRQDFLVSNGSMGGDPAVGIFKHAIVLHRLHGSPLRARVAGEGQSLPFGTDIQLITYGGAIVNDPTIYESAYRALISNSPFPINNNSMGGDTLPGTLKTATVTYYRNQQQPVTETRSEGDSFRWSARD